MSRMRYHFNVYIDKTKTDVPRTPAITTGMENWLQETILTAVNAKMPMSHREVEVIYVETFDADREERGDE